MKIQSIIPRLLIVFASTLFGASFGKVADFNPIYSAACGGVIAAIAVGIGTLFSSKTKELERKTLPRKLLGMRIGVVGVCVAIGGWLIGVFVSYETGYIVVAIGIGTGFVGMAIHFVNMLLK